MKTLILFFLVICVSELFAAEVKTYDDTNEFSKQQLQTYLESVGYISEGESPLDFMESNKVIEGQVKCTNEVVYDVVYIGVDSGEHSGLFLPGTLELKGEISQDAVFLYSSDSDQIDCFAQGK